MGFRLLCDKYKIHSFFIGYFVPNDQVISSENQTQFKNREIDIADETGRHIYELFLNYHIT